MAKVIVTFNSVTYALKGRKILSRSGIGARLIKVDAELTKSCTYGLEIDNNLFLDAVRLMKSAGLDYTVYNYRV